MREGIELCVRESEVVGESGKVAEGGGGREMREVRITQSLSREVGASEGFLKASLGQPKVRDPAIK